MKNLSIQNRIMLLALLPGILVALVVGAFFSIERSNDLDSLLNQRAITIAKHLSPSSEFGVTTGNLGILQNIANNTLEEQDVRAVTIYNQNQTELAHAGPRMQNTHKDSYELISDQLSILQTNEVVRVRAPIYAQSLVISDEISDSFFANRNPDMRLIGWAEVELSKANTRILRYQQIFTAVMVIICVLALCGYLVLSLSRSLTRPIQELLRTIALLEKGELDSRAHIYKVGEFDQMASGINAMANALQRTTDEYQTNLEQATRDLQETLDEMEMRNNELQAGRREALKANIMKSEFLANVSHEIRTPLNGIIGFSELLARTQLSEQQQDYLSTIYTSSDDLLKILNDILDLSKIDADKIILESVPINLRDILEEVFTRLAPLAAEKELSFNYLIYSDVPLNIKSDPLRLRQILGNLLSNAIKFTKQGGVSVRVSVLSSSDTSANIFFEIQDTGIGMSEEQRKNIFSAFAQGDSSTARKYGGTGLGLVISKALIEKMNGEISVSSQEGHGSTFKFHIETKIQKEPALSLPSLKGYQVALIEGSMFNRLNTGGLLNQWDIEHDDFESFTQFINNKSQYSDSHWDAILFAAANKRPDNFDVQKQLSILQDIDLPIILLTDHLRQECIDGFLKLGVSHVISQPYQRKHLHRLLCNTFNVSIPTQDDTEHSKRSTGTPMILVVDDNAANLKLVVTLLNELSLPVLAASSGQEAIEIVKEQDVDLIYMDIQMPEMNGLEATRHIRALQERGNMPIIALTAHAMADEKEALLKAGMNDYQTKPITQDRLIKNINHWTGYQCQAVTSELIKLPAPISNASNQVFDPKLALHHSNNKLDLAIDMFNLLLEGMAEEISDIMQAWEEEDISALLEYVHKMHGASRYCGVPQLRNTLENFEISLKAGKSSDWPEHMRNLVEESSKLQHWVSTNDWQMLLEESVAT